MQSKQHGATFALYLFKTLIQGDELQRSETGLVFIVFGLWNNPLHSDGEKRRKTRNVQCLPISFTSFTLRISPSPLLLSALPSLFLFERSRWYRTKSFNLFSHLNYSYIESSPLQIPSFKCETHSVYSRPQSFSCEIDREILNNDLFAQSLF